MIQITTGVAPVGAQQVFMTQHATRWAVVATSVALVVFASCATDSGGDGASSGATGSGGSDGSGTFAVSSGTGGIENPCDPEANCAAELFPAKVVPVALYLLIDRSASMADDGKWTALVTGLTSFLESDDLAGLQVAVEFFPYAPSPCTASQYAVPEVDAAPLTAELAPADPQEKKLIDALNAAMPTGVSTPMFAALTGAYDWAKAVAASGEAKPVVALVTDAAPEGCGGETQSEFVALAAQALKEAGTATYALALPGVSGAELDALASAGGTNKALVLNGGSIVSDMLAALGGLYASQIDCTFDIPKSSMELDTKQVNLCVNTQSEPTAAVQVTTSLDCGAGLEWHYDDIGQPQQLVLCPAACASAQGAASVQIVVGCNAIIK